MVDMENCVTEEAVAKPKKLIGVRHVQFFMLFLAAVIGYGMRTNLSEGIVAMTAEEKDRPDPDIPTYPEWKDNKNMMLSSFFWGYICLQIGAGQIAKKYGPKWFLCGAMSVTSLFSLLMPVMGENIGYGGIIICRVFQGLSQGFLFPSFHHLLSVWTPHSERSKVITFVYTGGPLGNVISLILTGYIGDSKLGWPAAFYLYGGIGLLWTVLWFFIGSNSPSENKLISDEEKKFIQSETIGDDHSKVTTPWKAIFTSLPVWAILIGHCGQNWGFWTLLSETPSYMDNILKYDLKQNALMAALPYFVLWVLSFIMSPICDYLITRKIASIGIVRKIFNTIGLFVPACALIGLSFVGESQDKLAVALLVVAVGINSATYCGFNVNHIDISPIHSGTLMGITNSLSNVWSIIAPLFIDLIKSFDYEESDKELWSIVFCFAAGVYLCTGTFFIIFASGEIQEWNDPNYLKKDKKDLKY